MSLLAHDRDGPAAEPVRLGCDLRARIPIWHGLETLPYGRGPCVAALGVFDGVHRGHAALLERAVELGRARGLPVVMVTFDPHPARVVGASRDTTALSSLSQRAEWAGALGVDAVTVLPFTGELAALSPIEFTQTVLVDALAVEAVVVGANFTFGARAAGTPDTLAALGETYGFSAHPEQLLPIDDTTCSSTHIRNCLRRGEVGAAAAALGRAHQVDARAHIGVLTVDEHTALPAPGRYRARFTSDPDHEPVELVGSVEIDAGRQLAPDPVLPTRPGTRVLVSFLDRGLL